MLFAYPKNRSVHHDAFERTHRFLGWTATALVWCQVRKEESHNETLTDASYLGQVVLLTNDYKEAGQGLANALVRSPPFWLVVVMTCSIILPWLRLRRVNVRCEVLSDHAVRMYFDYGKGCRFIP